MMAWTYDVVAYEGEYYCKTCLPATVLNDFDRIRPVYATDMVDEYPVCFECGAVHVYMTLVAKA